jgi:hypothetical protein
MSDNGWQTVARAARKPRDTTWYITEEQAKDMQKEQNIWGLKDALLSGESRRLQREGYVFDRVAPCDENTDVYDDEVRMRIEGNKWGDVVVWRK